MHIYIYIHINTLYHKCYNLSCYVTGCYSTVYYGMFLLRSQAGIRVDRQQGCDELLRLRVCMYIYIYTYIDI